MSFCVVGINHHISPIEIREKVHFKETDIIRATDVLLSEGVLEPVILSTCNRSEIYFITPHPDSAAEHVTGFYERFFNVSDLEDYIFFKSGSDALRHLFEVTIGLDSLVIGEDQILGQVRDAHETALEMGAARKRMNKVFREVITFAKRVKSETEVSDKALSISYVGVKQIREALNLSGVNCMLIGLGEMGRLALLYLRESEANLYICNRTMENSLKLAREENDLQVLEFEHFAEHLGEMDVLITATASPHIIVRASDIGERKKPLYIMDLSMPRDVDSKAGELPEVTLYDIDRLTGISEESAREIYTILNGYRVEIEDKIRELQIWDEQTLVDPIMQSLNERCDQIAEDTLRYIYRKTEMTHNQKRKVDKIVRSALKKVLREPLLQLRSMEDGEKKQHAIEALEEVLKR